MSMPPTDPPHWFDALPDWAARAVVDRVADYGVLDDVPRLGFQTRGFEASLQSAYDANIQHIHEILRTKGIPWVRPRGRDLEAASARFQELAADASGRSDG